MLNKVMLIGNLCADPEVRYMPSGDAITTIRLATTRRWKDRNTNERKEETEFHRVTFFGSLAKVAGDYLKKGSQVYVEGRIKTDKYQKAGVDVYRTGIVGEAMNMLGSRSNQDQSYNSGPSSAPAQQQAPQNSGGIPNDYDDYIPFMSLNYMIKSHLI